MVPPGDRKDVGALPALLPPSFGRNRDVGSRTRRARSVVRLPPTVTRHGFVPILIKLAVKNASHHRRPEKSLAPQCTASDAARLYRSLSKSFPIGTIPAFRRVASRSATSRPGPSARRLSIPVAIKSSDEAGPNISAVRPLRRRRQHLHRAREPASNWVAPTLQR